MGACCRRGSSYQVHDEKSTPWDPKVAAKDSWLDLSGGTRYDFLFVHLETIDGPGVAHWKVKVEVVNGGCGKASHFDFSDVNMSKLGDDRAKYDVVVMLAFKRSNSCSEVRFDIGSETVTVRLPELDDAWVKHSSLKAVDANIKVSCRLRGQPWETKLVTEDDVDLAGLKSHTFNLQAAEPGEKAVLTYKQKAGNTKLLYWMPGRNDAFGHVHVLRRLLDSGYDVFAIEHRRIGRSILGGSFRDYELISHVTDFRKYLEEFNLGLQFALKSGSYQEVVLYGHSTGGLEALFYLRDGQPELLKKISKVILNSPFLDWPMGGGTELALDSLDELQPFLNMLLGEKAETLKLKAPEPGDPDGYGTRLWMQYPGIASLTLRNPISNHVTAGWAAAVSKVQEELKRTPTEVPTLLLHTSGDSVLDGEELQMLAKSFCANVTTQEIKYCRHDMLANYFHEQNTEVLEFILSWLRGSW